MEVLQLRNLKVKNKNFIPTVYLDYVAHLSNGMRFSEQQIEVPDLGACATRKVHNTDFEHL